MAEAHERSYVFVWIRGSYSFGSGRSGATFDEQRAAVSASVETQPESAIVALLQAGIEEGKPTQAIAETRKWLRQNLPQDAMLLYHAGRAAELSGDASGAAALYQQYLKEADPKSETAGWAVIAVHVLLRDRLNDLSAAYAFNRGVGDQLAGNPAARQFDQWFLDEAMRRKDVVAVANRLHALIKAGIPDDLRVTYYDKHFRWLLEQSDIYVEQPGAAASSDELVAAIKQLCAAMTFEEELALRLDWAVSVRAYNLSKTGGDGSQGAKKPKKKKKNDQTAADEADRSTIRRRAADRRGDRTAGEVSATCPLGADRLGRRRQRSTLPQRPCEILAA